MKEFRDLLVQDEKDANVIVYGVPFDCNCSINSGTMKGPNKLRELSWWLPPYSMDGEPLSHIKLFDKGDFDIHSFEDIENSSLSFFQHRTMKVIFGGDHSISIPFQKAFINACLENKKEPVLVHIDAHCDICNVYFGNKNSHACTVRRALDNGLKESNLFMIGIREFEKDGYDFLLSRNNNVHLFKATEVLSSGVKRFKEELASKNDDNYEVYVSFDIDSLDSSYAPGTGTPETCGLTPMIVREILRYVGGFKNLRCLDLVEVSPPLDNNDVTSWTAIKLLYEFFACLKAR